MEESALPAGLREAVRFHGHLCPGLAMGYRAAAIGLERLGAERAEDEELIAIVENDSCSTDGVQWVTGCTFGKGNFFFRDYGKQAFTFALRGSGRAVRVVLRPADRRPPIPKGDRNAMMRQFLTAPADIVFDIQPVAIDLPDRAQVHESIACDGCGEGTMVTRTRRAGGRTLCIPCAERAEKGAPP